MEEKEATEERKSAPADSVANQMSNFKENATSTVTSLNIKQYIRQSSNEVTSSQESINSVQPDAPVPPVTPASAPALLASSSPNENSQESEENGKENGSLNPLYSPKTTPEKDRNGTEESTPTPTPTTPDFKRIHSDPMVQSSPSELKRINTFPNIDLEEEDKPEQAPRAHSIADSSDIFTIKFNAKNDAISFEQKPDDELENSISESMGLESPLSEIPSSPEYYRGAVPGETGGDSPASSVATRRSNNGGGGSDTSKSTTEVSGSRSAHKPGNEKKKNRNWYNVLSPTYKSRTEDFKKIFKDKLPSEERLIVDYSCALQKDILVHGRLYITPNWVCFYANIFRWETVLTIRCKDITHMTKEKTARVIPNAIQICTADDKYFFTSFGARDKTHFMLFRVWQNALMEQRMSPVELWHWVHSSYGEELGLTDSDCDYIPPSLEEKYQYQNLSEQLMVDKDMDGGSDAVIAIATAAKDSFTGGKRHSADIAEGQEPTEDSDSFLNGDVIRQLNVPSTGPTDAVSVSTTVSTVSSSVYVAPVVPSSPVPSPGLKVPVGEGAPRDDFQGDTDAGDTTEDDLEELGEVLCGDHDHTGFTSLEDVYFIPVDTMLEYLFSDNQFYRDFTASRKTTDVVFTPWPDAPDEDGNKTRTITYTLALNYSIGPKSSQAVEKQIWHGCSTAGRLHVLDTETVNAGVPYGDSFYVFNRYCITRVSPAKCRLRVTSGVRYRKSVWGLTKNFIDKNATAGIMESYNVLGEHLKLESERLRHLHMMSPTTSPSAQTATTKKRYTHKRKRVGSERNPNVKKAPDAGTLIPGTPSATPREVKGHGADSQRASQQQAPSSASLASMNVSVESVVKMICAVLVFLVLFNLLLFYKLSTLENRAGLLRGYPSKYADLHQPPVHAAPKSQAEWMELLQQQQQLHELEMERWREILSASITLMDHMKLTLNELHHSIEKRHDSPQPPPPPPPSKQTTEKYQEPAAEKYSESANQT